MLKKKKKRDQQYLQSGITNLYEAHFQARFPNIGAQCSIVAEMLKIIN